MIRGRWAIEDHLRWVCGMDFDEDRFQIRTASGPCHGGPAQPGISIRRLAGRVRIAAGLLYRVGQAQRPFQAIMKC